GKAGAKYGIAPDYEVRRTDKVEIVVPDEKEGVPSLVVAAENGKEPHPAKSENQGESGKTQREPAKEDHPSPPAKDKPGGTGVNDAAKGEPPITGLRPQDLPSVSTSMVRSKSMLTGDGQLRFAWKLLTSPQPQ